MSAQVIVAQIHGLVQQYANVVLHNGSSPKIAHQIFLLIEDYHVSNLLDRLQKIMNSVVLREYFDARQLATLKQDLAKFQMPTNRYQGVISFFQLILDTIPTISKAEIRSGWIYLKTNDPAVHQLANATLAYTDNFLATTHPKLRHELYNWVMCFQIKHL